MGYEAKKTEHARAKYGSGAYWGSKKDEKTEKALERIKHYLWHGNVFQALQIVEDLEGESYILDHSRKQKEVHKEQPGGRRPFV
jgi:hypothetical protein